MLIHDQLNILESTLYSFEGFECELSDKQYEVVEKFQFMFKDFVVNDRPLDKQSTLAARASYCAADQGKYWQYHDEVYNNSKGEDVG